VRALEHSDAVPPPRRTKWTRRVPHPVLIGQVSAALRRALSAKLSVPTPPARPSGVVLHGGGLASSSRSVLFFEHAGRWLGQAEMQQVETRRACVICCERPKTVVLLPCRHLSSCPSCSLALASCPLCRAAVASTITIFDS